MRSLLASVSFWLIVALITVVGTVMGMRMARHNVLERFASQNERNAWQEWRQAAGNDEGPVARKVPKSSEPPTLVLLRDHFAVCLIGMLTFETSLVLFLMFVVRGVLLGSTPANERPTSLP